MTFLTHHLTPTNTTPTPLHTYTLTKQTLQPKVISRKPVTALVTSQKQIITAHQQNIIVQQQTAAVTTTITTTENNTNKQSYEIKRAHTSFIGSVQMYQEEIFTSAAFDGKVKVWDTEKGVVNKNIILYTMISRIYLTKTLIVISLGGSAVQYDRQSIPSYYI